MIGTPRRSGRHGRNGQVAIFLLMAFVALAFLVLWNADLHRIVTLKTRSQDAGDAAALAAARWQASTLNLIGELNLMHALALSAGDAVAVDALTSIQARLCFTGPMAGLAAAQQAAKQNGIHADPEFTQAVADHAATVRNEYTRLIAGNMLFPEPYAGAWEDYADMLDIVAADGIAAAPDNARLFTDTTGDHILRDKAFYEAVAGRNWCWFFLNHPLLLEEYTDHTWWPALPLAEQQGYNNCEFYGVWVRPVAARLTQLASLPELSRPATAAGIDLTPVVADRVTAVQTWYCYDGGWWGPWDRIRTDGEDPFPLVGPVKAEYDYAGADALVRVQVDVQRLTPGLDGGTRRDAVGWTAAAKAFGYVGDETSREPPTTHGLVVPAFRDVRLIPLDASSMPGGGSFDLAWREHVDVHLPQYVTLGEYRAGCWYCQQLTIWDEPAFRLEGRTWLERNSALCTLPPPGGGGGGRGGGARHGH